MVIDIEEYLFKVYIIVMLQHFVQLHKPYHAHTYFDNLLDTDMIILHQGNTSSFSFPVAVKSWLPEKAFLRVGRVHPALPMFC